MLNLFSPLILGRLRLPNRIVLAALPSGFSTPGGFANDMLGKYYVDMARGGAGMLVFEHAHVLAPHDRMAPHLGLYDDTQVVDLRRYVAEIHAGGTTVLVMLDQPLPVLTLNAHAIADVGEAFIRAAWRVRAIGADGVMLSTSDGGPFEQLVSPLQNHRDDSYGGAVAGRLRLLLEVVEGIRKWIGESFTIGIRLNVEEFAPGGLTLQDARVIAKRLIGAGVRLLEVRARTSGDAPIARFPGWLAPLAAAIKAVVEVPVLVGGLSDDAALADDVIRDGSADLVALSEILHADPLWPQAARAALERRLLDSSSATPD